MGTQLVPLLARLLTTLAALPLDSLECRDGAHVSGGRSDGSKNNSGQTHNILNTALTFALDATFPAGRSVETIESGARVAAASLLRYFYIFYTTCLYLTLLCAKLFISYGRVLIFLICSDGSQSMAGVAKNCFRRHQHSGRQLQIRQ